MFNPKNISFWLLGIGIGLLAMPWHYGGLGLILFAFLFELNGIKENYEQKDINKISDQLHEINRKLGSKNFPLYGLDDLKGTLDEISSKLGSNGYGIRAKQSLL